MKSIQQETVAGTKADEIDLIAGTSLWHDAWKRLRKNNMALSSGVIMVCLGVACLCGPAILGIIWGYDAHTQNLAYGPQPPSLQHPFGTDFYGRDLLVRVLTGARVSLSVGVLAALVAASIGTIYGAVSSYNGGLVDSFMMRTVDILYALPYMFLVIILVTILGKSLLLLFLALGAVGWLLTARVEPQGTGFHFGSSESWNNKSRYYFSTLNSKYTWSSHCDIYTHRSFDDFAGGIPFFSGSWRPATPAKPWQSH